MTKNEKAAPEKSLSKNTLDKTSNPPGSSSDTKDVKEKNPSAVNWPLRMLMVLLLLIVGAGTSIYFMPALKERLPFVANWIGENEASGIAGVNQTLADQQQQIENLVRKSADQELALSQLSSEPRSVAGEGFERRLQTLEGMIEIDAQNSSDQNATSQDTSQAARIDMLLSRMSQLEASFVPLSKNMLDTITAEKDRQELRSENIVVSGKISDLEARLTQVETIAAKDNTGLLLNLKIADLKRKLKSGTSYENELAAITDMVEKSTLKANARITNALSYLSDRAAEGVTTPDQLRKNFNELIPDILKQGNLTVDASWWETTLNTIKSMVTVRKTDGTSFNNAGLDGLIATIEQWLAGDDFKSVLDNLSALPDVVQLLLEEWKVEIERWSKSDDALNDLESIAAEDYLNVNYEAPVSQNEIETEL